MWADDTPDRIATVQAHARDIADREGFDYPQGLAVESLVCHLDTDETPCTETGGASYYWHPSVTGWYAWTSDEQPKFNQINPPVWPLQKHYVPSQTRHVRPIDTPLQVFSRKTFYTPTEKKALCMRNLAMLKGILTPPFTHAMPPEVKEGIKRQIEDLERLLCRMNALETL